MSIDENKNRVEPNEEQIKEIADYLNSGLILRWRAFPNACLVAFQMNNYAFKS